MLREQLEGEQQGHQQGEREQHIREEVIEQHAGEQGDNMISHHRSFVMDNVVQPQQ